jgi:hypothetical protein
MTPSKIDYLVTLTDLIFKIIPVIYPKEIKDKLNSISLGLLHREGGLEENKPFQFSNYLFYNHPVTSMDIRIGYARFPRLDGTYKNLGIFEICYCSKDCGSWLDITPDFRKKQWRKISRNYA